MSKRKKPQSRPHRGAGPHRKQSGPPKRLTAREKRDLRAKAKRQRQVQAMGIGFKERFMSGCIAAGFLALFALVFYLVWAWITSPD